MNNGLAIRNLTPADADVLLGFYRQLSPRIVHWFDPFPQPNIEKLSTHLASAAIGEAISLGLVSSDGSIVGHGFILAVSAPAPVFGCGLCESVIGAKFGRKLMQAVMAEADRRKIPRVCLTVFKDNMRARRLYESFGFIDTGEAQCRTAGDSLAMYRLCDGTSGGAMHRALLQHLNGYRPDCAVWTADLSYWIAGCRQKGTADPAWDDEEGYLQLHRDFGVMPYYDYKCFWSGEAVFDGTIQDIRKQQDDGHIHILKTPVGTLREESVFLPDSCCHGIVKHMIETETDLDVMLYALEHRRLVPANISDYNTRRKLWAYYDGLPCIGLPRSPLPAFACEWAGLQNMVMLMLDCPDKVLNALSLMEQQEAPVLDAVCDLAPPLVHFPDNLSSDNLTSYYDEHMLQRHRTRLDRLHNAGIKAAVHLDGAVRGLLPKLISNGFDVIEALTPRPVGDMTVDEMAKAAESSRVILWGGVPGAMFAPTYDWHSMKAHVGHVLEIWGKRPFVLGVADQVPPDGNINFCRNIRDMLGFSTA